MTRRRKQTAEALYKPSGDIWKRQDWDTDAGYGYFATYYLPMATPRSVDGAFRNYLKTEKGYKDTTGHTATTAWRRWSRAEDKRGHKIAGALPWWERAQAFDDHKLQTFQDHIINKQTSQIEAEIRRIEKLEDLYDRLIDGLPMFFKAGTKSILNPTTGETMYVDTLKINATELKRIAELLQKIISMKRLTLGMPQHVIEQQIGGNGKPIEYTPVGLADEMVKVFNEMAEFEKHLLSNGKPNDSS